MIRPHRFTAFLLLLAVVGCTVERRPSTTNGEESGSGNGAETVDAAGVRAFLEQLQEGRRAGRIAFVRERLDPEALLFPGDQLVEGAGAPLSDDVERLLAPAVRIEGWELSGFEVGDDSVAVVVVRYPSVSPEGRRPLETLVLAPDSAGWRIRLLVRAFEGPDPPGP